MTLTAGSKLGPYEIVAPIGAGGMGEVYRARDSRVGRDVAIKVAAEQFGERFEREARAVAALNHPNICTLYDVGPNYLVMELVEGPTLADRIKQGPIPLDEALTIARQIADALEAAHEKGIVHRDLKPANIKLKPDGTVKVLDFGLAKVAETSPASSANSPTISVLATQQGVILGTAAYMSPEQARGKLVDKRADIWAFGVVLYEMLTGQSAFGGEDVGEILASVIKVDVNLDLLPNDTPARLRELVGRCLQKDLKKRMRDIGDARFDLVQAMARPQAPEAVVGSQAAAATRSRWKTPAALLLGLILGATIAGGAIWYFRTPAAGKTMRFSFVLPEEQTFTTYGHSRIAIAPDGSSFVYLANGRIFLRRFSESESHPILEPEQTPRTPFFSPDGQWIGFWSYSESALKKVSISGGPAVTLCRQVSGYLGGDWKGETILFAKNDGIFAVSAGGGTPESWLNPDPGELLQMPQFPPGGDSILFSATKDRTSDSGNIVFYSRKTGKRKILIPGSSHFRYLSKGSIVYGVGASLMMVPLDLGTMEVTSGPVPVLEDVLKTATQFSNNTHFAVSENGTLLYIPSSSVDMEESKRVIVSVDRAGKVDPLNLPPGSYNRLRFTRDGKQLAVETSDEGGTIWIHDMAGKSPPRKLTSEGRSAYPVWSPDGRQLAFLSATPNGQKILLQAADFSSPAKQIALFPDTRACRPGSWSPDGKTLAVSMQKGSNLWEIWTVNLTGDERPELFVAASTTWGGVDRAFSPDGHWIAYLSDWNNRGFQIFVQPFPKIGASRYQLTREGTIIAPMWSPDGKTLFYYNTDSKRLFSVSVRTQPSFSWDSPVALPLDGMIQPESPAYDVTPDGKRLLVILPERQSRERHRQAQQINVVLNWLEEIEQRVPIGEK